MINFDLTKVEAKCEGRRILANGAGISLEDAAEHFINATHENFKDSFNKFVKAFPEASEKISKNRPDGIGPGEMLAWFIFDNITLGGKNSSVDLLVDGMPFAEMKAGTITKKTNTLDYFKIAKDTDPSVNLILNDLVKFNEMHSAITGNDLPGWEGVSSIKVTALALWESINLTVLQRITPAAKKRKYVPIDPDGTVLHVNEESRVGSIDDPDLAIKLKALLAEETPVRVDKTIDTLRKIVDRWKTQVFTDYVGGKTFALIDTSTFTMHHFGGISPNVLGLYRVHRNQPWARIYLDKLGE